MKEIPLLFSAPMVRATIEGRKDVTRRLAKPYLPRIGDGAVPHDLVIERDGFTHRGCPYGAPGDLIWVREAWRVGKPHDDRRPRDILPPLLERGKGVTVLYEAGGWRSVGPVGREEPNYPDDMPMPDWAGKLRPSIHMPRAFTRIVRPIISVRLEHLHAITPADARREGVTAMLREQSFIDAFRELWDGLNAARGAGWNTNPLVWRIEYERRAEA